MGENGWSMFFPTLILRNQSDLGRCKKPEVSFSHDFAQSLPQTSQTHLKMTKSRTTHVGIDFQLFLRIGRAPNLVITGFLVHDAGNTNLTHPPQSLMPSCQST